MCERRPLWSCSVTAPLVRRWNCGARCFPVDGGSTQAQGRGHRRRRVNVWMDAASHMKSGLLPGRWWMGGWRRQLRHLPELLLLLRALQSHTHGAPPPWRRCGQRGWLRLLCLSVHFVVVTFSLKQQLEAEPSRSRAAEAAVLIKLHELN